MVNFKLPTLLLIASSALSYAKISWYSVIAYTDAICEAETFTSATGSFDVCVDMGKSKLRSIAFEPEASAIKCPTDSSVVLSVYSKQECTGDVISYYNLEGCLPLSKNQTMLEVGSWHARCVPSKTA
ncbi:hypothetical protein BDV32DRAFT_148094 [Aspergillus pseudonomiae]|uniref:Uncharacterized protein n=1 Tax=Aspergillus pseudonomiae TaxID=1506151 RepID=A0A5N6I7P9_9EURO|nr:uncharacterized protein BDV37DRAFT_283856 [Aspergillus pseudonomiae]KAB8261770.1 hypothetical protein BDV32DRAFT_148094 [Aspergillus pseudonomiae]KAE8403248.1 hypothetical protein BDV37DRAFT_283856 [Aspergillus pseudonomiae]